MDDYVNWAIDRLIVPKILPDMLSSIHLSTMIVISPFIMIVDHRGFISVIIIHDAIIISSDRHSTFFFYSDTVICNASSSINNSNIVTIINSWVMNYLSTRYLLTQNDIYRHRVRSFFSILYGPERNRRKCIIFCIWYYSCH